MTPLAGRRIWFSRPAGQRAGLESLLRAAGARPHWQPLLDILPSAEPERLHHALRELAHYRLAIAVSPTALEMTLAELTALDLTWPETLPLALVGPGSERAARAAGFTRLIVPPLQHDSAGLLALPELQQLAGQRVLLLRGNGGRELLPDTLRQRGAQLDVVSAYQRHGSALDAPRLQADLALGCDAWVITSSEAAAHLFDSGGAEIRQSLQSLLYCVPHPQIAESLQERGASRILHSGTGDAALLACLTQHFAASGTPDQPLPDPHA